MKPPFNPFPHRIQSNSSTSTLPPQQVFPSNMLQNSVPMQHQMGIMNPQIPCPLNNSNGHAMPMPNMPPITQPNLINAANPLLFLQNNHLGLPQFGGPMFQPHGNFGNLPQNANQGQIFATNLLNLPQQLNQNMGLANGQMFLQNVNQLLSMQMSNPGLFMNPQFGLVNCNGAEQHVNQNQQNFGQPIVDVRGNSTTPLKSCSTGPQQSQNSQPSGFMRPQGKSFQNGWGSTSNTNWKNVPGKNISRNPTREPSQRFQKSQFHQMNNAKRKFGFHNDQKAKGRANGKAIKFGQVYHMNEPKEKKRKSLALTYTEQEIKQWCEERAKNYPTKANINKKLAEKLSNSDVIDKEAKIRREQLKEILTKQAELGVEVAEIPPHYLSDSEKQVHGKEGTWRSSNKRGRFHNKHDKRGRYNKKDQFAKKQKLAADKDSSNTSSFNKRKPTLLQRLLSADIKRDKSHLLQAFKFMVINSFFKDWPEKPLKFPLVTVKESGVAREVVEAKSVLVGKAVSADNSRTTAENLDHDSENTKKQNPNIQTFADDDVDDDNENNEDEDEDEDKHVKYYVGGKCGMAEENVAVEEEEGEIID